MKKWPLLTVLLSGIVLTGCNCNCDYEKAINDDAFLDKATEYCTDNWGTHSLIHSPTAVYGECSFPSWVICEDTILWTDECNFKPNLEDIDTEEKRLSGCEENIQSWMTDMVEGSDNIIIEWENEEEDWTRFIRNGLVKYSKDWSNWKMDLECAADFVDWSLWVSFEDAEIEE